MIEKNKYKYGVDLGRFRGHLGSALQKKINALKE